MDGGSEVVGTWCGCRSVVEAKGGGSQPGGESLISTSIGHVESSVVSVAIRVTTGKPGLGECMGRWVIPVGDVGVGAEAAHRGWAKGKGGIAI